MSEIDASVQPARWSAMQFLPLWAGTVVIAILPCLQWGVWGVPAAILLGVLGCLVLREPKRLVGALVCTAVLTGVFAASLILFSVGVAVIVGPILVTVFAYRALRERDWWVGAIPTVSLLTGVFIAAFFLFVLLRGLPVLGAPMLVTIFASSRLYDRDGLGAAIILVMALIMILFAMAITAPNHRALRVQCANNLKQLGLALGAYREANGHYPPPYTTDETGKPLHSWRVLILPYIEEPHLYEEFDLTKPWHHPKNLALADRMPYVYNCPYHRLETDGNSVTTDYVAIVGDHTAWPRSAVRRPEDIIDGLSKTLLLVESEKHRIHWMSTADPGIETLGPIDGQGKTLLDQGPHENAFLCVFCDGAVRYLERDYEFSDFLALLTIDGSEEHNLPWLEKKGK